MTSPYDIFKTKEKIKVNNEPRCLDYTHFKIYVKYGGTQNRTFLNAVQTKFKPFERRQRLANEGKLSDEAVELLDKERSRLMAELYADHVIVNWENVKDEKGKNLPYNRENVVKLMLDLDALFADIIQAASDEANFAEKEKEEAQKN